jgi:hypothetical protein
MSYDHLALEADCRALWEREDLYRFDRDGEGEIAICSGCTRPTCRS